MKSVVTLGVLAWALKATAQSGPIPPDHILYGADYQKPIEDVDSVDKRAPQGSGGSAVTCTNGPLTRSCWSDGFNVATDFDKKWPNTGVTRSVSKTPSIKKQALICAYLAVSSYGPKHHLQSRWVRKPYMHDVQWPDSRSDDYCRSVQHARLSPRTSLTCLQTGVTRYKSL